ncbi:hypothetical protein WMY93_014538 [Mugilogobius chulae]|uniref:Uncharacterized protein n=1 Tax=Mugilogobius chulae TaxID=88201 RepID=A0AAW0NVT5_9GOBI
MALLASFQLCKWNPSVGSWQTEYHNHTISHFPNTVSHRDRDCCKCDRKPTNAGQSRQCCLSSHFEYKMTKTSKVTNSASQTTVVALSFFLIALLILLFFLYKYLNKKANGKYTVQRIVYREGGLRDRARAASVAVGNRLGVQLWPQSDADQNEDDGEDDEEMGQLNSNGDEGSDNDEEEEEEATENGDDQKSESAEGLDKSKGSPENTSEDSSGDEEEPLIESESKSEAGKTEEPEAAEAQEEKEEPSGPVVVNLNQFSGGVLWSGEDKSQDIERGESDITEF